MKDPSMLRNFGNSNEKRSWYTHKVADLAKKIEQTEGRQKMRARKQSTLTVSGKKPVFF